MEAAVAEALRCQDLVYADAPQVAGADQRGEIGMAPVDVFDVQLYEGGHIGQLDVGQQRTDDGARAIRADEDVAAGSVAAVECQLPSSAGSRGRRDKPVPPDDRVVGEGIEQKITQCAPVDLGTSGE